MGNRIKDYLDSLRTYIIFNARLLILSSVAGVFIALNYPQETRNVVNWAQDSLSPGVELSGENLFFFIFKNNLNALFYSLAESIMFGLSSIGLVVANGIIIGVFMVIVSEKASLGYFIVGIFPHGMFEIPAALISSSMGLKLGVTILRKIMRRKASVISEAVNAFLVFFAVVVPLLLVAAAVEAFITPVLLSALT